LLHQRGHLAEAASLYREILAQNPEHADAIHLLGVIELQRGNLSAALTGIDRAIAIDPTKAAYFSNRAMVLQDLKRFSEALVSYDRALAIRPDNPEVLNNRAILIGSHAEHLTRVLRAHVGQEFDIVVSYKIAKQYRFGLGYGFLWAGPFLREATAHGNVSYPYSFLTYSF